MTEEMREAFDRHIITRTTDRWGQKFCDEHWITWQAAIASTEARYKPAVDYLYQAIGRDYGSLEPLQAMQAWESSVLKSAISDADAKYLPVIEKLVGALRIARYEIETTKEFEGIFYGSHYGSSECKQPIDLIDEALAEAKLRGVV